MANCDLSIELDSTRDDHTYDAGEKIRGVVRVRVDKDVNCSGLEVKTLWATHGRGNVDSDVCDSKVVFTGQWSAGQTKEYPFELTVGHWPPTYHGHYLNVDHYLEARAKIPWGFDPKASLPFRMRPTTHSEGASNVIEVKGPMAAVSGVVFVIAFLGVGFAVFASGGWFMLPFFLLIPMGGAIFALFRYVLPKWALGKVDCQIDAERVSPGQEVNGLLTIQPKKSVTVNAITLILSAEERCVSGSGSKRKTHKHPIFDVTYTISDATTLRPQDKHQFPLNFQLPFGAPYSLDLTDNDLKWTATINIDVPRWPDWRKSLVISVVPGKTPTIAPVTHGRMPETLSTPANPANSPGDEITFAETASHLWSVRDDREQMAILVEAVAGLTFDIQAIVERRLLYAGDDDPHVSKDGYAVWAHYPAPELPMVLYVPHELADEFEQIGTDAWYGRGTIVGWDKSHGRLQVKLELT